MTTMHPPLPKDDAKTDYLLKKIKSFFIIFRRYVSISMKLTIKNQPYDSSRAFDDSSLPSTEPAISKERSLEIENLIMPPLNEETEKLRQTEPHLFVKRN